MIVKLEIEIDCEIIYDNEPPSEDYIIDKLKENLEIFSSTIIDEEAQTDILLNSYTITGKIIKT